MAYTKQVWRDLETGGTPITAERLNHIEDGIEENSNNWDSISPIEIQITSKIKAVKSGNHVHIRVRNFPAPSNHYSAVGTVPESWKPKDTESNALSIGGNENESIPFVEVLSSTGDVCIETKGRSGNMNGSLDYIVQ